MILLMFTNIQSSFLFLPSPSGALPSVVSGSGCADRCSCQGETKTGFYLVCMWADSNTYMYMSSSYPAMIFRLLTTRPVLLRNEQKKETGNLMTGGKSSKWVSCCCGVDSFIILLMHLKYLFLLSLETIKCKNFPPFLTKSNKLSN